MTAPSAPAPLARALRLPQKGERGPAETVKPRLTVGFVLLRRFTLCAFANFIDVLRLAADEGDRSRQIHCRWSVISPDMTPVTSSCGLSLQPQERFGDPARFDYIVVVGGLIDEMEGKNDQIDRFLKTAAEKGVPLVGLCTGAFILHRAGLMDGYRCCVSWFHHSDFLKQFDGLRPVSDQIFVVDRDRLTCSGGASAAHLAAFLVERHVGRAEATKSLHIMMINEAAVGETPQPGFTLDLQTDDLIVKRALILMQQTMDAPLPIEKIAERLDVDKRLVERHFKAALGHSPLVAYTNLRLEQARHLLDHTDKSIAAIATECGFCDSSHLGRIFRRHFGTTPKLYRDRRWPGPAGPGPDDADRYAGA